MKTITEFHGPALVLAHTQMTEWKTAGKTEEEIPALITEKYKYEGDKLELFRQALAISESRQTGLKRVVFVALNEGEKAPAGVLEKEGKHYTIEFFPSAQSAKRSGRGHEDRDGGRDGRRGKRGDRKGGRGGERGGRGQGHGQEGNRDGARFEGGRGRRPQRNAPGVHLQFSGEKGSENTIEGASPASPTTNEGGGAPGAPRGPRHRQRRRPRGAPRGPRPAAADGTAVSADGATTPGQAPTPRPPRPTNGVSLSLAEIRKNAATAAGISPPAPSVAAESAPAASATSATE